MNWPTELKENEVFVFGSNEEGFHGAGAAGYAFRGTSENTWRSDSRFLAALNTHRTGVKDVYHTKIGKWAEFGVGRGLQKGSEGQSYAIATVTRPGQKRSISLYEISKQIVKLWSYAYDHEDLQFLIAPIATGYGGYRHDEMSKVWHNIFNQFGKPNNVTFLFEIDQPQDYRMS